MPFVNKHRTYHENTQIVQLNSIFVSVDDDVRKRNEIFSSQINYCGRLYQNVYGNLQQTLVHNKIALLK